MAKDFFSVLSIFFDPVRLIVGVIVVFLTYVALRWLSRHTKIFDSEGGDKDKKARG